MLARLATGRKPRSKVAAKLQRAVPPASTTPQIPTTTGENPPRVDGPEDEQLPGRPGLERSYMSYVCSRLPFTPPTFVFECSGLNATPMIGLAASPLYDALWKIWKLEQSPLVGASSLEVVVASSRWW
ncbi:hypothetical protein BDZ89DRAFT_1044430 [Hymenopellis radicata]|nr:hypothetical protein BDZ89DRAFT_1044430 [Hymenopellis radicata]